MQYAVIIPFTAGMLYLLAVVIIKSIKWTRGLSRIDKLRLIQLVFSVRILRSVKEIFVEGLLHRKIFQKNPVLGYMHMSLAFGWFLLIVFGHFEVWTAEGSLAVPFHKPIFFRYFDTGEAFFMHQSFAFTMDLLLLFVLSGLTLAIAKRFYRSWFGLKRTTKLRTGDRIALASLWLIFPLRLMAESSTAGIRENGSFLTNSLGHLMNPGFAQIAETPLWIAYSSALLLFFVFLPHSRYMHIPVEMVLIVFRNAGIRLKKLPNSYTEVQVFACSRCGICLDNCQLSEAGIQNSQSVYLLKSIRNGQLSDEQLFNCLMCGKCQADCPVGIDTVDLRITQRIESTMQYNSSYDYLKQLPVNKADIVYFAGCMTHLTPSIIKSMEKLFALSSEKVWFMDREKSPCCGRPLMLAGQYQAAEVLMASNLEAILASGAKKLVVSCPICYKVFKEDYKLPNVEVVFHAEYILNLIKEQPLSFERSNERLIYHDPCELGRGMKMYEEPRCVIEQLGNLIPMKHERENAFCCGGSLGNLKISQTERNQLQKQAVAEFRSYRPEALVTACPMCKKTFVRHKDLKVMDIAEVTASKIH